jgi:hypothetical protein
VAADQERGESTTPIFPDGLWVDSIFILAPRFPEVVFAG